ncbi:MAG: tetratricopeptide repeat protein [Lentisphaerae bacterium]|nr:tetratricopeptide repeat protein [Lentisphaerota bacterium]
MAQIRWHGLATAAMVALLLGAGCGPQPNRAALQEGLRALDSGQYAQSLRLLQRAVQDNTSREDTALAYNGLGIAYGRLQQNDQARRAFENAARLNPRLVEPVYNLGVLQFAAGQPAEALISLEKAALLDTHTTRTLEFLAQIYRQRQEWDEVRRVLTAAQARAPQAPSVLTALALLELQTNNVIGAQALLQRALEHDAHYPPAVFNLAVVHQRHTLNPEPALNNFKDYLGLVPAGPQADQARRALPGLVQAARAAQPPSGVAEPLRVSAQELLENAGKLERAGRREAAFNNYLRAVHEAERAAQSQVLSLALRKAESLAVNDARANYELGIYYAEHKQSEPALIFLKKAVSLKDDWFDAHLALAQAALLAQELDTARVSVRQADRYRPDQADALWHLARLCDQQAALHDLAAQFYARFAKAYPADARSATARARVRALPAQGRTNQR